MSDRAEAGEVMIEADDLPAVFDADRRDDGVGDQVARGVGISKTRRFVATRRNAPHTSAGTAKRSSPASISSNHRPDRRVVGVVGAL